MLNSVVTLLDNPMPLILLVEEQIPPRNGDCSFDAGKLTHSRSKAGSLTDLT